MLVVLGVLVGFGTQVTDMVWGVIIIGEVFLKTMRYLLLLYVGFSTNHKSSKVTMSSQCLLTDQRTHDERRH